ncbi:MAG: ATP-dependent Clp protease ATP-binding subunit ClpA [Bdellovibrionales bacterium]|jgi:ATP-dependent Clp protease ATP-binding subunit ClpA
MLSPHLEDTLHRALTLASVHHHEYATLEHLLLALTEDPDALPVLTACAVDVGVLQASLDHYLEEELDVLITDQIVEPLPTMGFQRALQRAVIQVQSAGKTEATGAHLLAALFQERESHAVFSLTQQNVTRLDIVNFIAHGLKKKATHHKKAKDLSKESAGSDEAQNDSEELESYCINLNQKAAQGNIDPLIGRDKEIERTIQILCRRQKNNPLFVGEAGVGKTAIVEGLARRIVRNEVPDVLKEATILTLDLGSLVAGTRYRGDFEERLKNVLAAIKKIPHAILFIDEIHSVIGAGATSSGSMDASNLLKPALTEGAFRCIGSTTYKEYSAIFKKDHALARRFQKINVEEPSIEEAVTILMGLKTTFESYHDVLYSDEALRAAVELSARHINDRKLPDKAIDVIDEVGAAQKLIPQGSHQKIIEAKDIEAVIAKMAQIPAHSVSQDDKTILQHLGRDLAAMVFGQNEAIQALASAIKLARAGLREVEKPIGSYLFSGPTGVGKTEVARQLAKNMGIELKRFDMSEYMEKHSIARLIGAPPGYIGFEQGGLLTDAVDQHPHCVVLLDEIEKAHPDLFNILLQIMDHGQLTDHNGKSVNFRNVILIMTTNAGAADLARAVIGFERTTRTDDDYEAIQRLFTPEFRGRLDAIIGFKTLTPETMARIVDKFILQLENQIADRAVSLTVSERARGWLGKKGYDPLYGARPLARLIQEKIKKPLAEELLFGKLQNGGTILVGVNEATDTLTFLFKEPFSPPPAPEKMPKEKEAEEPLETA